jgi:mutator protein MutT
MRRGQLKDSVRDRAGLEPDAVTLKTVEASVALVVFDERALVLRRRPEDRSFAEQWCLPGGRVEEGETAVDAAVREIFEETGLALEIDRGLGPRAVQLPERGIAFTIHRFVGRCEHALVELSDEHVDSRWLTRAESALAETLLPGGLAGEVTAELLALFAKGAFALHRG